MARQFQGPGALKYEVPVAHALDAASDDGIETRCGVLRLVCGSQGDREREVAGYAPSDSSSSRRALRFRRTSSGSEGGATTEAADTGGGRRATFFFFFCCRLANERGAGITSLLSHRRGQALSPRTNCWESPACQGQCYLMFAETGTSVQAGRGSAAFAENEGPAVVRGPVLRPGCGCSRSEHETSNASRLSNQLGETELLELLITGHGRLRIPVHHVKVLP